MWTLPSMDTTREGPGLAFMKRRPHHCGALPQLGVQKSRLVQVEELQAGRFRADRYRQAAAEATWANCALPGMGAPKVTTLTSAAGHMSAAQGPAMAATPAPRLCPDTMTRVGDTGPPARIPFPP